MSAAPRSQAAPSATPQPRRSGRPALLLALLFAAPLLLAWVAYFGSLWRPAGHTNHGELIQPPLPLRGAVFQGKWSLVYVGSGECDAACRSTLYFMRQTHWGLGDLAPRVQRLFLATDHCCASDLASAYPDLIELDQGGPAGAQLLTAFPSDGRATALFIVDPHGNLMMRYDSRAAPKGLLEDLKQLLQLSSIG